MDIISKEDFLARKEFYKKIMETSIFIYPTDTIYGLGCSAMHMELVKELRTIKDSGISPFSVIAPSKEWIKENCVVDEKAQKWIDKLPGPYTLVLKIKNEGCVAKNVSPEMEALGVRIPDHWISGIVRELGIPVVTTSVNVTGEEFMTSLDDLDPQIAHVVDYIFYEGEVSGAPSKIVHLEDGSERIQEREGKRKE